MYVDERVTDAGRQCRGNWTAVDAGATTACCQYFPGQEQVVATMLDSRRVERLCNRPGKVARYLELCIDCRAHGSGSHQV